MNYSKLIKTAYSYLGSSAEPNRETDDMINECIKEVEKTAVYKCKHAEYDSCLPFLNKEPYITFLKNSDRYIITVSTLGIGIDRKIRFYTQTDMAKAVIFDAVASAYLEEMANVFDSSLITNPTYRFCPGYGGSSVSDLVPLFNEIKPETIGVYLNPGNTMIPEKTMVGIIGNGGNKKSCSQCMFNGNCLYKKEGTKCLDQIQ